MISILALFASVAAASGEGLSIIIRGEGVRTVELDCRTGHRERQTPRRQRADMDARVEFRTIPDDECMAHFKGMTPRRFGPLPRSGTLECQMDGRVARCTPAMPPTTLQDRDASARPVTEAQVRSPSVPSAPSRPRQSTGPTGGLEIALFDAQGVRGFDLTCRDGHRERTRRPVDGSPARFDVVPSAECRVHFLGTPPAVIHSIQPGTHLDCHVRGVTAVCEERPLGD